MMGGMPGKRASGHDGMCVKEERKKETEAKTRTHSLATIKGFGHCL